MPSFVRHIFLIALCLLMTETVSFSQKRRRPTATASHRGRFKQINISRAKAKVVCPIFEESQYPYMGIGVKIGDPFALTYKFYPSKSFSIAIDAGKSASGLYSKYHRENFEGLTQSDTLNFDQGIDYLSHIVKSEWVVEGKLLYQRDASKLLKGLQWYVGGGWQWRKPSIQYEYLLEISFDENEIKTIDESYLTMGPTVVWGIEYSYFTLPISAFMEIEWYTDVLKDPGWSRFQGGVGLRVIF
jgi:hypothetical protein